MARHRHRKKRALRGKRRTSPAQRAHQKRFAKAAKACWKEVREGDLTRKQVPGCIREKLKKSSG